MKRPAKKWIDPDSTLGGRLASALVAVVACLPVIVLIPFATLWIFDLVALPWSYMGYLAGGLAAFGFLFPKVLPALFEGLVTILFGDIERR